MQLKIQMSKIFSLNLIKSRFMLQFSAHIQYVLNLQYVALCIVHIVRSSLVLCSSSFEDGLCLTFGARATVFWRLSVVKVRHLAVHVTV